jgi:acyl carrier protein
VLHDLAQAIEHVTNGRLCADDVVPEAELFPLEEEDADAPHLDLDSLEALDLLVYIEGCYGRPVRDDVGAYGITTVRQFCEFVYNRIAPDARSE